MEFSEIHQMLARKLGGVHEKAYQGCRWIPKKKELRPKSGLQIERETVTSNHKIRRFSGY